MPEADKGSTRRIMSYRPFRAGFAPQTFHRHFRDKTAIFLAVYECWVDEEIAAIGTTKNATEAAEILIQHHRASLKFRRTLRSLTLTDARVREARARSRVAQIALLRQRFALLAAREPADLAISLLMTERLTDAHVEGELQDLGVPEAISRTELIRRLARELGIRRGDGCKRRVARQSGRSAGKGAKESSRIALPCPRITLSLPPFGCNRFTRPR